MRRILRWIIGLCFLVSLGIAWLYYPELPEKMASHFSASGQANGWMKKSEFFLIFLGVFLLDTILFLFLPQIFSKIPDAMIHLPNRDHWLHPSRKEQTLKVFHVYMAWWGASTAVFLLVIMAACIAANFQTPPRIPAFVGWMVLIYLIQSLVSTAAFSLRFLKKTTD